MSLDPHSLERLRELGRQLPKEISKPNPSNPNNLTPPKNKNLHPVEIEENPEQLFRDLMDISHDGNVPDHLIDRLKKLESHELEFNSSNNPEETDLNISSKPKKRSNNDSLNLYTAFNQLLLEDDI